MHSHSTRTPFNTGVDYLLKFGAAVAVFLPVNMHCPLLFQIVLVSLYVAVLLLVARKGVSMDWLGMKLEGSHDGKKGHLATSWLFFGFYLLCAMLGYLEWSQPFYFTQDDNHSQFLPVIIQGMQGFFAEGVLPTWNPFLNLGHQTASVGVYTFTYPVTYIAYLISRFLIGSDLYHIEVFACLHFFAGYFFLYAALKAAGVRPVIAVAGSLCFVLCGFNLIAGRSWMIAQPYTAWLPALAWSVVAFERSKVVSLRWVVLTGLAIGLSFHGGHAQLWFYGMLCWGISIVWLIYCMPGRRWHLFLSACSTGFLGLAIAAPLLLIQWLELLGDVTNSQWDEGIGVGLNNLILPFPLMNSPHPNSDWGIHPDYMGALYYSGSVFIILFMIKCVCEVTYIIKGRQGSGRAFDLTTLTFAIPLILVFWWSLGEQGRLWSWLAHIPPINNMNCPFKFLPYIALYSIMASAPFLERLVRRFDLSRYSQCAIAALAIGLISINAIAGKYPWMDFGDRPYPPLPEAMKPLQVPAEFTDKAIRIIPFSPWRSQTLNYANTLPHNYPSYYRILSTDGYNLAVTGNYEHRKADIRRVRFLEQFLREFGVHGITVAHQVIDEPVSEFKQKELGFLRNMTGDPRIISDVGDIYFPVKVGHIKPIAFARTPQGIMSLSFRIRPNGVEMKVREEFRNAHFITANFLFRRWFRATGDGNTALPVFADNWGRIAVKNVNHSALITIRYLPPWGRGILLGVVFMLLSFGAWKLSAKHNAGA